MALGDKKAEQRWDGFAARDPHYFTHPGFTPDEYDSTGEETVTALLAEHAASAPRRTALEIGAGMGRLTLPLARRFDQVVALDISPAFLAILRSRSADAGLPNIEAMPVDGPWQQRDGYDLVLSIYALQHVRHWGVIRAYIAAIGRLLTQDGVAILQFDTRPPTLGYRLRQHLPGFLTPRPLKPGFRRVRRDPRALRDQFAAAGLEVIHNEGPETHFDLYVLRRR